MSTTGILHLVSLSSPSSSSTGQWRRVIWSSKRSLRLHLFTDRTLEFCTHVAFDEPLDEWGKKGDVYVLVYPRASTPSSSSSSSSSSAEASTSTSTAKSDEEGGKTEVEFIFYGKDDSEWKEWIWVAEDDTVHPIRYLDDDAGVVPWAHQVVARGYLPLTSLTSYFAEAMRKLREKEERLGMRRKAGHRPIRRPTDDTTHQRKKRKLESIYVPPPEGATADCPSPSSSSPTSPTTPSSSIKGESPHVFSMAPLLTLASNIQRSTHARKQFYDYEFQFMRLGKWSSSRAQASQGPPRHRRHGHAMRAPPPPITASDFSETQSSTSTPPTTTCEISDADAPSPASTVVGLPDVGDEEDSGGSTSTIIVTEPPGTVTKSGLLTPPIGTTDIDIA